MQLKEDYKAVQHISHQVAVNLKTEYKAAFHILTQSNITAEVHGSTEWINSIKPVKKPDGSPKLCQDRKDLNKAIHRNLLCMGIKGDIRKNLVKTAVVSVVDRVSGYWHVPWILNAVYRLHLTCHGTNFGGCSYHVASR